jgi:predicted HD superfamily hydrolase involved in NAD metabolism
MIEDIKRSVVEKLDHDPIRLKHVMGVYETAVRLAIKYDADIHKISIASLFHDYAKNDSLESYQAVLTEEELIKYSDFPVMYHALSAVSQLKSMFDIHDEDIISAIKSHIWGRPQMNIYEKIVFVSDYAEPNRKFFDPSKIYDLAIKDLDLAVLKCMELTFNYLNKLGMKPSIEQIEAYQYYMEVNSGKTEQNY